MNISRADYAEYLAEPEVERAERDGGMVLAAFLVIAIVSGLTGFLIGALL